VPVDGWQEGEVFMITNAVHSSPVLPNEASAATAPRQNAAPQQASLPQDKVTLSRQAQVQAHQAASADKDHDGDNK
jgi:hypothetical protein